MLLFATGGVRAAENADAAYAAQVAPVLQEFCFSCHSGAKPEGGLALDILAPDFSKNPDLWDNVLQRVTDGSMPPEGKPSPTADQRKTVSDWVATGLTKQQQKLAALHGRAQTRRLTRLEYVNTLRDLLGVTIDTESLPEDGMASGFNNVDVGLDFSATLLERYLDTAEFALDAVFVSGPNPARKIHVDLAALGREKNREKGTPLFGPHAIVREKDVVFQTGNRPTRIIPGTGVTLAGNYRIRVSANAENHGQQLSFLLYAGNYGFPPPTTSRMLGAFSVPDKPTVIELTRYLRADDSLRIAPYGLPDLFEGYPVDPDGPGLALQWIEIDGPLYSAWPPVGTRRLLGNLNLAKGTIADARAILRRFVPRAFRRPVKDQEIAPFVDLVQSQLDSTKDVPHGQRFEKALRVGLKAVLCSPDFLYLSAAPGALNDYDLATRLSYFLWSSAPDDALIGLAEQGRLGQADVLREQVERMLDSRKAQSFTESFTGQWLSLRDLNATMPDGRLYPEYDDFLEWSMPRESRLFFEEILKHDRSLLEFVHSDWSIVNERLATLYGIPGVAGAKFRRISLPPDCHRGGVMTQAAVLKVTANGTSTSPVVRGAWVLDRILGTSLPPRPKEVPAIEPDIRGAETFREQLARHRQSESCAKCHVEIDPPGNALESFDVIGGWRQWYRAVAVQSPTKKWVELRGVNGSINVNQGPDVDSADELSDGRAFSGIDELKKLILASPDTIARCLTEKLLVYSTGHKMEVADREAVQSIVQEIKAKDYGFRSLIHAIVQSSTFRRK